MCLFTIRPWETTILREGVDGGFSVGDVFAAGDVAGEDAGEGDACCFGRHSFVGFFEFVFDFDLLAGDSC